MVLQVYFWIFLATVILNVFTNLEKAGKPSGYYSVGKALFVLGLWVPFLYFLFKEVY